MPRVRVLLLARAVLLVVGVALTALGVGPRGDEAAASATPRAAAAWREPPAIEAREALPAGEAREGEQLRVVSVGVSTPRRAPDPTTCHAAALRASSRARDGAAPRWCDVVQCRRLGGARLLGFATPPPAHG